MNKSSHVKHPCVGCVYFKVCGNTGRTEPCYGRITKSEKKKDQQLKGNTEDTNRNKRK